LEVYFRSAPASTGREKSLRLSSSTPECSSLDLVDFLRPEARVDARGQFRRILVLTTHSSLDGELYVPDPVRPARLESAPMGRIVDLVDRAWDLYAAAGATVVKPSMPILWFGDSAAYFNSRVRVVTVGLNPSRVEFPEADRFLRFPSARSLSLSVDPPTRRPIYVRALDDYFRSEPYRPWFDRGFERVLNGMATSYYEGRPSTALHTDLFSPLATDPTWSGLDAIAREALAQNGLPVWHDLMRELEPDVIIVSVARRHLTQISFPRLGDRHDVHTVERERPFVTEAVAVEVVARKRTTLAFGRCVNLPFGSVSSEAKNAIGAAIEAHRA
jgi:hypothetical protein